MARGPTMAMECGHEWGLRVKSLEEALDRAEKEEGMPGKQLRKLYGRQCWATWRKHFVGA